MSSEDCEITARLLFQRSTTAFGSRPHAFEIIEHHINTDRSAEIEAYNECAALFGIKELIIEDFKDDAFEYIPGKPESWLRKNLRRTSSVLNIKDVKGHTLKRALSGGNLLRKRDALEGKDLKELGRIQGDSILFLGPNNVRCNYLLLPTHLVATAQHLVDYALKTPGLFQTSGSQNMIESLYTHYASIEEDESIDQTAQTSKLPMHIIYQCDVHDVASTFKRFLSVLPGGILGELHLFHSLANIYGHFKDDDELDNSELDATKLDTTKLDLSIKSKKHCRALLITRAILTVDTKSRRHLIYAVFGLVRMVGQNAEAKAAEHRLKGRELEANSVGYEALGAVFGPLLIGEFLKYNMPRAHPKGKLVVLPISSPKSKKGKGRMPTIDESGFLSLDEKKQLASSIAEMVISHWLDVVVFLKMLDLPQGEKGKLGIKGARTTKEIESQLESPTSVRSLDADTRATNKIRREKHEERIEKQRALRSKSKSSQSLPANESRSFIFPSFEPHANENKPMQSPKHISEEENQPMAVSCDMAILKSPIKSPINFSRPYGELTPKLSRSEDPFGTPSSKYTELHRMFEEQSRSNTMADLAKTATLRTSHLHSPIGPSEPSRRMISNAPIHKKKSYGNLSTSVMPGTITKPLHTQTADPTPLISKKISKSDVLPNKINTSQSNFGQDGQQHELPKKNSLFARSKARLTGQNKTSESNSSTHSHGSKLSRFSLKRTASLASIKETMNKTERKVKELTGKSGTKVMALKALYEPSHDSNNSALSSPNKLRKSISENKRSVEIQRMRSIVAPYTYSSPSVVPVSNEKDTLISTLRARIDSLEKRLDVALEEKDGLRKENRELKQLVQLMMRVRDQQKGYCTGSAGFDGAESSSEGSSSTVLRT